MLVLPTLNPTTAAGEKSHGLQEVVKPGQGGQGIFLLII